MRRFGLNLLAILFTLQTITSNAQLERPKPGSTLTLEADRSALPAGYPADYHKLLVTYTNVSDQAVKDNCANAAWKYDMLVSRDGAPVEKKRSAGNTPKVGDTSGRHKIQVHITEADGCGGPAHAIPPRGRINFPLWVSSFYDMTVPGTYTITVKRETFPFDPAKSATVWSNTITIVVPAAGEKAPEQ